LQEAVEKTLARQFWVCCGQETRPKAWPEWADQRTGLGRGKGTARVHLAHGMAEAGAALGKRSATLLT